MKRATANIRVLSILIVILSSTQLAKGQYSITGATCVVAGTQYTYTISGNWNNNTQMSWVITGGTISGPTSGTPLPQVHVTWTSSGTLQVNVPPSSGGSINVTLATTLVAGTISTTTQSINYNTVPTFPLSCSAATGGYCSPSYQYQWQQSTNNVTFTNITGATGLTYTITTNLTQTMYYRLMVTEINSGSVGYSNTSTVIVYPQLQPGTISPSSQTIAYAATATLTLSGVSGGSGTYGYQWQISPDGVNYQNINFANSTTYTTPNQIFVNYYRVIVTSNNYSANSSVATVNIGPAVYPGVLTPSSINITSNTSPGVLSANPASGGSCGSFAYQWQSSTNGTTFSNISGATAQNYTPGNLTANTWYRRQVTCGSDIEYTNVCAVTIGLATPSLNMIRVREILKPGVADSTTASGLSSTADVHQSSQYFDGVGKLLQTVTMQGTPLQKDMVSFNVYDQFSRETEKFLPYVATTTDGNYKPSFFQDQGTFNAAQYPGEVSYYSQSNIENSSLNRVLNSYPQGSSWVGSLRGTTDQYLLNAATDSVRIWTIASTPGSLPTTTSIYAATMLTKNISIDEQNHQVVQYTDKEGHMVLKKVQLTASPGTAHAGWLCTYYIYDDLNNLRFVIPPQAVFLINSNWTLTTGIANELCFRYEYDQRKRMSIKKIPGAGELWMVYDSRDRVVMTQDSNLRVAGKWMVTRYDSLNRPDTTGLLTDANNQAYHQNNAYYSVNYPSVSANFELLTSNYYDDYTWITRTGATVGSSMATNETSNSNYFYTTFNSSPTYAVAMTPLYVTRSLATGLMKKVIGTSSQYLYSVNFYDDRGRVIQSQSVNYTGGIDTVTTQYDFSGKPLRTVLGHVKKNNTVQNHIVVTKMDYDNWFRLRHTYKNIDNASSDQLIDSMQYDEIGQLRAKYLGNNIDSLIYDYNIRGWLTGINKNYVAGTTNHFFGMELGYDKTTSAANGNTYITPEYNGNIEGIAWKSAGSNINRKYDFSYDNASRFLGAAYLQNTSGSSWDKTTIDFSVSNLSYDFNGNILSMTQNGFTVGGSGAIDQLTYAYQSNSNKLSQVTDAANNPTTLLGDFHYSGSKGSYDYLYDGNGNLSIDNNKAIDKINYNYLNLPQLVHLNTKGNIAYTYDAAGDKLTKVTVDSTIRHATTTLYIGPFVYQQNDTITNPTGGTDTLQFISHEEGRTRWAYHKYTTGYSAYKFEYDFFEKDHLGNTRMVLTQQKDTSNYLASMEAAYRATEKQIFGNITQTCYPRASVPGYPNNTSITNPNDSVAKVDYNGTSGQKQGPNLLLKVMSGDTVKIAVQSYWNTNTITTTNSSFNDVLTSLANGLVNTTGGAHGNVTNLTASNSNVYTGLTSFLNADDPAAPSGYPKAYLNWIFLDDQFSYVSSLSGSVLAASSTYPAATLNTVAPGSQLIANKSGYLYIWVSNETQGWDVFFDNLSVQHRQGILLEENHYYPFGLTMQGISDKAIKPNYAENKFRYNKGSELQNKEFSDGSGLEMYETNLRELDPQLGRWWQLDNKPNYAQSLYSAMGNDPILHNDPLGDSILPNVQYDYKNTSTPSHASDLGSTVNDGIRITSASSTNVNELKY